ncbi:hypothetical protein [Algoriphagus zhangzhouensis]|uniref:Uncharacterized protein n=1 Tax=Algoriphagus zhangzhouensis TaxID=1073327 RepID=A0A1M7ZHG9_9BACT|nr:hypothetical protein [Algoriphagus zhangzhouensis]TDY44164.1 hypothetical protein A8938_3375 [Algoriphagus zhangzhouensis]SHO64317.1 hypothetical protein SAMN04488108_3370 [Algoriphagus zhangzhouensis]
MKKLNNIRQGLLIAFYLITISCKDGKGNEERIIESTEIDSKTNIPISNQTFDIEKLKEAYKTKNEAQFLEQFPADFQQFMEYFGWNNKSDQPNELYEESYTYIEYFFDLISDSKYLEFESKLTSIAENGVWQEDAANYFQDFTLDYIQSKKRYHLIDNLSSDQAKSVLFFLFDGPHPKFDADFASQLSPSKNEILEELFESGFYDQNENPDPIDYEDPDPIDYEGSIAYEITDFENLEHYFIRDIDINNDKILDKIVSADPYQGDELFLFIKKGDQYQFALKTTNFSQDGGNQIVDVFAEEGGFYVKTAFPDRGFFEANYHITFKDYSWILTNTIYKTKSSNQIDAFIYVCDVKQELNLEDKHFHEQLKWMPEEGEKEILCTKEKIN